MAKQGYDTYLTAATSKRKYHSKSPDLNVVQIPLRYVPVISPILFGLITLFFFPLKIIKMKPDFVIVEPGTATYCFWKPLLSLFMKLKVILDVRSTNVDTSGLRGFLKNSQSNISVRLAKNMFDGMTTITSAMKKEISEEFNLDPKSIGVWSDGVSIELFAYEKSAPFGLELRKEFGLSDKFVIFYHGSLSLARGVLECVEAITRIKKEYPKVVLFFLGTCDKETLHAMKNLIKENGLQDRVIIHDPVDYEDVPKYIAMCDVGLVPLPNIAIWRNQCPLKLLEYLAMERTVIVTDIPANREIVGDQKCGIYISSSYPIEIAKAIEFAYENREKLQEWGKLGRIIVARKYNWDRAAKDLETYLVKLEHARKRFTQ